MLPEYSKNTYFRNKQANASLLSKSTSNIAASSIKPDADIFRQRKHSSEVRKIFMEYLQNTKNKTPLSDRMEVMLQLSKTELELGNNIEAENWLNKCEEWILSHGKQEEIALVYNIRANLCVILSQLDQGLTWSLRALQLFQQLGLPY